MLRTGFLLLEADFIHLPELLPVQIEHLPRASGSDVGNEFQLSTENRCLNVRHSVIIPELIVHITHRRLPLPSYRIQVFRIIPRPVKTAPPSPLVMSLFPKNEMEPINEPVPAGIPS